MTLLKTSTIAACAIALSGGVALAQGTHMGTTGPGGATGTGTVENIGNNTPNSGQAAPGNNSTSVLSHTNKAQSAAGERSSNYTGSEQSRYAGDGQQAAAPYGNTNTRGRAGVGVVDPSAQGATQTFIVDEYGRKYNRMGERIR